MYQWMVFLHVLAALIFFMAHGASAIMALRLSREQNPDRIRALLDLSETSLPVMMISLLVLLIAGIIAGIMGNWWSQGWIWVSLVLLIGVFVWMGVYAQRRYAPLRKALGIDYRGKPGDNPPANDAEIHALIQAANPVLLAVGGLGIGGVILWLMIFKPF